ncbi:MAG: hypothetical protein JWM87_741 [Candidatus Eremiobacteraeota bacterium]|nr:hypothetical protein [Candidatus Eremiobacteraeota bacterium]
MRQAVANRLSRTAERVGRTMTFDQLRLHFFWIERERARQLRADEIAIARGITRGAWGKDPDTGQAL